MFHKQAACSQICTCFLFHQLQCERCSDPKLPWRSPDTKSEQTHICYLLQQKRKLRHNQGKGYGIYTPVGDSWSCWHLSPKFSFEHKHSCDFFFYLCHAFHTLSKAGEGILLHTYFEYIKISFQKSTSFNDMDTNLLIVIKTTLLIQNFGGKNLNMSLRSSQQVVYFCLETLGSFLASSYLQL